jgi:hypothetical protein
LCKFRTVSCQFFLYHLTYTVCRLLLCTFRCSLCKLLLVHTTSHLYASTVPLALLVISCLVFACLFLSGSLHTFCLDSHHSTPFCLGNHLFLIPVKWGFFTA